MKPVFYNKKGIPVFDAHNPEGAVKLEVECLCNETFNIHVCFDKCPDAFNYKGIGANNPDWQG